MELTLNNFQAWETASIEVEGLTVMVGPSNRGKSSFTRALRGVLRNDVSERRIRRGTKSTRVTATFDGHAVEVKRTAGTKGEVTYCVDGQDYAKLGGKVPPSVEALNFGRVSVGSYSLDPIFAGQFDGQFLLAADPAEVTAVLNAFASTDRLDRGRKVLTSRTNELNAEAKALAALVSQGELDFAAADAQVEAATPTMGRVRTFAALLRRVSAATEALERLRTLRQEHVGLRAQLTSAEATQARLEPALALFKAAVRGRRASQAAQALDRLRRQTYQVRMLDDCRAAALQPYTQAATAARALRAMRAARESSRKASALVALTPVAAYVATAFRQLTTTTLLGNLRTSHTLLRQRQTALEGLQADLNRLLITWKARVRLVALQTLDVEGPRALAAQVHDTRGAFVRPTSLVQALGIIQRLQVIKIRAAAIPDVSPELADLNAERETLNQQLTSLLSKAVTCPKCHHQFTPVGA